MCHAFKFIVFLPLLTAVALSQSAVKHLNLTTGPS